jgi:hypothetical protein
MSGGFKKIWKRLWTELWVPLAETQGHAELFFADIYLGLTRAPRPPVEPNMPPPEAFDGEGNLIDQGQLEIMEKYRTDLAEYQTLRSDYELASNGQGSKEALRKILRSKGETEIDALACLNKVYLVIQGMEEPDLVALYVRMLREIIDTYNIGYILVDPFILAPTVPGVMSRLFGEIKRLSDRDTHIQQLFRDYEEACVDLSSGATSGRIKSCIHKQFMLSEAIAKQTSNTKEKTLGAMCDEIKTWPHVTIKDVAKKLYGFRSDYPGFGHGSNPETAREVDLRDFFGISCMLIGLLPYINADINVDAIYRG